MLAGKDISMMDGVLISITGILMVFLELLLLAIIVTLLSKIVGSIQKKRAGKNDDTNVATDTTPVQTGTPLPETESAGSLDLVNVSEEEAALIMAIVSNQSGIPLNKLSFKSIKLVEENK